MPDERASITFCGQPFHVVDSSESVVDTLGYPLWMRFAQAARSDVDAHSLEGAALVYDVLKASIVAEEWLAFEQLATDNKCDAGVMWQALLDALGAIAERPTQRPGDSSAGPQTPSTPQSSGDDSGSRVIRRLEEQGRPDLALLVLATQESLAS